MTHLETFQNESEFYNTKENIDMKCQLLQPVSVAAGTCGQGTVGLVTFLVARDLFVCDCSGFISV